MSRFQSGGFGGVLFTSNRCSLLGGFYKAAGDTPRPTAILRMVFRASKAS